VTLIFGFDKEIWRLGKVESWCDDPKKWAVHFRVHLARKELSFSQLSNFGLDLSIG
jgi:hypothetical protein